MRSDYNHEVLATEREPEGQAKRSKSDRTGPLFQHQWAAPQHSANKFSQCVRLAPLVLA